jgi:hypothetical protein
MGRENLEDYTADFLVMLESWEAAVVFAGRARQTSEPTDIAAILGWVRKEDRSPQRNIFRRRLRISGDVAGKNSGKLSTGRPGGYRKKIA